MATRKILTDAGIRAAVARAQTTGRAIWKSDGAIPRSHGGLQLYANPEGTPRWYWRYSKADGTKPRVPMGAQVFTKGDGETTFTLSQARERVAQLAALYVAPESRDVRAYLDRQKKREVAELEAAERAREAVERVRIAEAESTLAGLFAAYVARLRNLGKQSARDAANLFRNHVEQAHPEIATLPAKDVKPAQVNVLLRALVDAGKGRTAAKLRAYMRAAYALAARAELDSSEPAAFLRFAVEFNPVQPTAALPQFNRARERTLSEVELRAYWDALNAEPDSATRDAQLLALLLGGQRPAQLVRATIADVDVQARRLRLHDTKGRRTHARVHVLPISEAALPVAQRCIDRAARQKSTWLFSLQGSHPLAAQTMGDQCTAIAGTLLAQPNWRRIVREPFQLRDIRRTCETALARLGISKEVRAQIQSHGLGGVQAHHYDRHDYMPEKTATLDAWAKYLQTAPADNVRQVRDVRH